MKVSVPPGATGLAGQFLLTRSAGVVLEGQATVTDAEMLLPHRLVALAVSVSPNGPQSFAGVV